MKVIHPQQVPRRGVGPDFTHTPHMCAGGGRDIGGGTRLTVLPLAPCSIVGSPLDGSRVTPLGASPLTY